MRNKSNILIFVMFVFFMTNLSFSSYKVDVNKIFPEIEGWKKKGNPQIYLPDNLFEYINGAAEVYLSYDFMKLFSLSYESKKKQSIIIDIYQHINLNNTFGIYCQEKPLKGDFLNIGTQGYYEEGILNFFKGVYYVKLSSFDLGDKDRSILTSIAKKIEEELEGTSNFPEPVKCLPQREKIINSERYIAKNFLGYSFLNSAFVADYKINDKKFMVFIIESYDNKKAKDILDNYIKFIKDKEIKLFENNGIYCFKDPYYKSSGMMNIKKRKNYVWGLFMDDLSVCEFYLKKIEENLVKHKLIK